MIYHGKFACGHEGDIDIIGPSRDREWKANYAFAYSCPECRRKEKEQRRATETASAFQNAAEEQWPSLSGTEKQINWGVICRERVISRMRNVIVTSEEKHPGKFANEIHETQEAIAWFAKNATSAHFWIENLESSVGKMLELYRESLELTEAKEIKKAMHKDIISECGIRPDGEASDHYAKISIADDEVLVSYPIKNDTLIATVKKMKYRWRDGMWRFKITVISGTPQDRAAEAACRLLDAGICVLIQDAEVRNKVICGSYESIYPRWVSASEADDCFYIWWDGEDNEIYQLAKKLPRSRWVDGKISVPSEFYKEVRDFAELEEFRLSAGARRLIEVRSATEATVMSIKPLPPKEIRVSAEGLEAILTRGDEIPDDLRDDD